MHCQAAAGGEESIYLGGLHDSPIATPSTVSNML